MNNLTINQQLTLELLQDTLSLKTILHRFRRANLKLQYTQSRTKQYYIYEYNHPKISATLLLPYTTEDDEYINYRLSISLNNTGWPRNILLDSHLKITEAIRYCQEIVSE